MRIPVLVAILLVLAGLPASALDTLTVEDAVAQALQRHPRILSAASQTDASQARVGQASAAYYPTVTASASSTQSSRNTATTNNNLITIGNPGGGNSASRNSSNASINVQQTIYDFQQRKFRVQSAKESLEATRQDLARTQQDVALTVRTAYYAAHSAQQLVRINEQRVALAEQRLRQAEGFYEAGMRAKIEVTQSRTDLSQARLALVQAQNDLKRTWIDLNVAMGTPDDDQYTLVVDAPRDEERYSRDTLLETAAQERPELKAASADIRGAVAQIEALKRDWLPTLSASGSYGGATTTGNPINDSWTIGLRLDFNIFNGFLTQNQVKEAQAQAQSLTHQAEQTRQTVFQEVANALNDLEASWQRIQVSETAVQQARENFELAQRRYEVGLGTFLEYQNAQVLLVESESEQVSALNDYMVNRARLARAVGVDTPAALTALSED